MRDMHHLIRSVGKALTIADMMSAVLSLVVMMLGIGWGNMAGAEEVTLGDVTVYAYPLGQSKTNSWHGYREFRFLITNHSATEDRVVRLRYPDNLYDEKGDHIERIEKVVAVPAGQRKEVVMYQLPLKVAGSPRVAVVTDEGEDGKLDVMVSSGHGINGGWRGGGKYQLLVSPRAYREFEPLLEAEETRYEEYRKDKGKGKAGSSGGTFPGMPGISGMMMPGMKMPMSTSDKEDVLVFPFRAFEFARSDLSVDLWSSHWLGYSCYDGVIVTGEELSEAGAGVQEAVARYVECGGSLMVLGDWEQPSHWREQEAEPVMYRSLSFTDPWMPRQHRSTQEEIAENVKKIEAVIAKPDWEAIKDRVECRYYLAGFGRALVNVEASNDVSLDQWFVYWMRGMCLRTSMPWGHVTNTGEAHEKFAVIDELGIPVRGLSVLILGFAVVIGPLNLLLFSHRKKRFRILWSVPVFSLMMCGVIVLYALFSEGFLYRVRGHGLTLLDQGAHRATTLGYLGYYSSLSRSAGLMFDLDSELTPQLSLSPYGHYRNDSSGTAREVTFTQGQQLGRGWIRARIPSYFMQRRSETRRERLSVTAEDGGVSVVNGLGSGISYLVVCDESGKRFEGRDVGMGAERVLEPMGHSDDPNDVERHWDNNFYTTDWIRTLNEVQTPFDFRKIYVAPGCYLAMTEGNVFIDTGVEKAEESLSGLVYGYWRE